ncbi:MULTISPECIES: ergothioneine biosynthesis protein EgtB [Pseudofrankia]|uniref:ergothioneine biosynthesis protein EgtB n=1 Tax=Pseudofrankia TaxID=2994363 RepID=UPI000234B26D|nr:MULTISPECIES: ergothioneine biosynthesis protein EgtB [Pseudofrankia]OHV39572.1 sulfatase-modifying factor 1 [Pseudofrankia sp. EUN1h]
MTTTAAGWAAALEGSRRRTLAYTDLDDDELLRQHSPLMSPLVWDLAHVGNYEELWLIRALTGADPLLPGIDDIYDAFRHPRADRPTLPLLSPSQARAYLADVRDRALDTFATLDARGTLAPPDVALAESAQAAGAARIAGPAAPPAAAVPGQTTLDLPGRLLTGGFVYGMVVQHEHQHDETMLATLQLRAGEPVVDEGAPPPPGRPVPGDDEVLVPAGEFVMGTSTDLWAYDNERPAHRVALPDFRIGRLPVSNRAHLAFLADGGYDDERLWSAAGWAWRCREGLTAPLFWRRDGAGGWLRRRFGRDEPLPLDEPVQHVCWYEAQAHARWAGRRLPTEAEWEKACAFDPATGRSRRFPWGDQAPAPEHANLGHRSARPAPLGAYPAGASPCGAEQLIGDVWEWTSSDFAAYPGFAAFPYREYSDVFFRPPADPADAVAGHGAASAGAGTPTDIEREFRGYKVLRGGSWATDPGAVRATFRNWDHPIRRQIFAGFRLARTGA